ncbi:MAG: HPF/RaiA family ribosome-associated protein [Lentisphaeria bacterium]|nr:HPF/RaiA family ribosome-associated protein [Lentisphaeria bacterium]
MDITVSARHFTITEAERQSAIDLINARFADLSLKIISASIVFDIQGNRAIAEVVINAKNDLTATARVEDFDRNKALDAAIQKVETQIDKYLAKRKNHKDGETLTDLEAKNAAKEK